MKRLNFTQSIKILQNTKNPRALIQTDKSAYNPSEKVNLRVLLLNDKSMPYQPSDHEIFYVSVKDEFNRDVFKEENIVFEEFPGIFETSFDISETSGIGELTVEVGKIYTDTIEAVKEVLKQEIIEINEKIRENFEVFVESKFATSFEDKTLKLKISANYSFGYPVMGKVVINTKVFEKYNPEKSWQGMTKVANISDETQIDFDLIDDLKVLDHQKTPVIVEFDLEFTKIFTGKTKKVKHSFVICINDCQKIEFINPFSEIKPGLSYIFQINVYQMETMELVDDDILLVKAEIKYYMETSTCPKETSFDLQTFNSTLNEGSSELELQIPLQTSKIQISLTYQNSTAEVQLKTVNIKSQENLKLTMISNK